MSGSLVQLGLVQVANAWCKGDSLPVGAGSSLYVWDLELLPDSGPGRDLPKLLGPGNGQGGSKKDQGMESRKELAFAIS